MLHLAHPPEPGQTCCTPKLVLQIHEILLSPQDQDSSSTTPSTGCLRVAVTYSNRKQAQMNQYR